MNEIMQAADVLRREATRTRGLLEAAEALEKVGSLVQVAEEAERRRHSAEQELQSLGARITTAREDLEQARTQHDEILAGARKSAEDSAADAEKSRAAVLQGARDEAQGLIASAKAEAEAERVKAASIMADAVAAQSSAKAAVDNAAKTVEKKRAELEDIESRIAEARRTITKMIGA